MLKTYFSISLLVALLGLPFGQACAQHASSFVAETVFTATLPVNSMDCGDLDPSVSGLEVAILTSDGHVSLLTPGSGLWDGYEVVAFDDPNPGTTNRATVAVGDLYTDVPGEEIAVMSRTYLNVAVRTPTDQWQVQTLVNYYGVVGTAWGARVGDYRPSIPGEEVFLIFEGCLDFSTGTVFHRDGGQWFDEIVYSAEVGMDSVAGEFDSSHDGHEVIITTEMGPTYKTHEVPDPPVGGWPKEEAWNDMDLAGWVCHIADVDETNPGAEVVYGTRYNNSILVSHSVGPGWHYMDLVFTGENQNYSRNMLDIATGDLVFESGTADIVGVDGSGRVYLVHRDQGMWIGETIWRDPAGTLTSVVVADFLPRFPGDEILVAGSSGVVTMLHRSAPSSVPDGSHWFATLRSSLGNHPNPFNPETIIHFELTEAAPVELTVHSLDGRIVSRLYSGDLGVGDHEFSWRGKDAGGRRVASGNYFYRLEVRGQSLMGRMALVK